MNAFPFKKAINYSGYRAFQSPLKQRYPSQEEILEDLRLLQDEFYYLRLFDCSVHAYRTLQVITEHNLPFKVLLGLHLLPEENHDNHAFFPKHDDFTLQRNVLRNDDRVQEIIDLTNKYEAIVSAVSVGNETRSPWNNSRVPVSTLIKAVQTIQSKTSKPVTFCEEYHTWIEELDELAQVVDFISLHTYPAWQGKHIDEAVQSAIKDYQTVQNKYPDKYCIITETGWPTSSHGSRIKQEMATAEHQKIYHQGIMKWAEQQGTLVYLFEAFDEPWKGADDPEEPEKNWGLYYVNRTRKWT